jgi:hypothetical protein
MTLSITSIRLGWKGLPETNTSLFRTFINYGRKKFYNTGSRSKKISAYLAIFFSSSLIIFNDEMWDNIFSGMRASVDTMALLQLIQIVVNT